MTNLSDPLQSLSQWHAVLQDPRVDVCVYFIAPHRLKQVDVEFMKQLSAVGPALLLVTECLHTLSRFFNASQHYHSLV